MPIETLDRHTVTATDAHDAAELLIRIFPKPGRTVDSLAADVLQKLGSHAGPDDERPRMFVVREAGRVVACAQAIPRTLGTAAGDLTVLALARVCTDPAVRGKHLGQAVVRAAFDLVDHGPYPFSLFQTTPDVRPFYEKLGCVTVDNHFVNSLADDPQANPFWNSEIMRYPAAPGWPGGTIDTRGPGW